jgi:hypothetical protein
MDCPPLSVSFFHDRNGPSLQPPTAAMRIGPFNRHATDSNGRSSFAFYPFRILVDTPFSIFSHTVIACHPSSPNISSPLLYASLRPYCPSLFLLRQLSSPSPCFLAYSPASLSLRVVPLLWLKWLFIMVLVVRKGPGSASGRQMGAAPGDGIHDGPCCPGLRRSRNTQSRSM